MTKATAPVAPVAPVATPAPVKPFSLSIGAPLNEAIQEAVVHSRAGYCLSDGPVQVTPTGWAFFTMILGNASDHVIAKAQASIELNVKLEADKYRKAVEQAAKQMLEDQQRAKLEMDLAAEVALHEKKIADLQKAAAAAAAKLSQ
jgi:hypothetical protein